MQVYNLGPALIWRANSYTFIFKNQKLAHLTNHQFPRLVAGYRCIRAKKPGTKDIAQKRCLEEQVNLKSFEEYLLQKTSVLLAWRQIQPRTPWELFHEFSPFSHTADRLHFWLHQPKDTLKKRTWDKSHTQVCNELEETQNMIVSYC